VGLREEELVGEAGGVEMQQGEELLGEKKELGRPLRVISRTW
jgi:hypothetical protein